MSFERFASKYCTAAFALSAMGACTAEEQLYPELENGGASGSMGSAQSDGGSVVDDRDAAVAVPTPRVTVEMISIGARADAAPEEIDTTGGTIVLRDDNVLYWGVGGTMGEARGFSVATLAEDGTLAVPVATFDTFRTSDGDQTETARLNDYLDTLSTGTTVMIGVADDAGITQGTWPEEMPSRNCEPLTDPTTEALRAKLESLGSTLLGSYCYRDSWAMAAVVGEGIALDEAHGQDEPASIRVELEW